MKEECYPRVSESTVTFYWLHTGFGLVIEFIEHFKLVTTDNCNSFADLRTLYKSLYCSTNKVFHIFTSCCLVMASKNGYTSVSVLTSVGRSVGQIAADTRQHSHSKLVTLRPTVSQPSVLVSSPIWGPRPNLCYCQTMRFCRCGAPSLTRGRVSHLPPFIVSSRYHLYVQFYMSALYIISCQRVRFLVDTYCLQFYT
jgi:hypothetical protein